MRRPAFLQRSAKRSPSLETLTMSCNQQGQVRRERWQGREWIVVPATSIVPGVLPGSKGPLYYPPDETGKNPSKWDGTPLVMNHPVDGTGKHVSAKTPGVVQRTGLGIARNSRFKGKLLHEAWFDVNQTREVDRRYGTDILDRLTTGEPIELSTGLWTDNEPAPSGSVAPDGRTYTHVARNHRPDHIAVLPNQKGACSLEDGCGIGVNESGLLANESRDGSTGQFSGEEDHEGEEKSASSTPVPTVEAPTPKPSTPAFSPGKKPVKEKVLKRSDAAAKGSTEAIARVQEMAKNEGDGSGSLGSEMLSPDGEMIGKKKTSFVRCLKRGVFQRADGTDRGQMSHSAKQGLAHTGEEVMAKVAKKGKNSEKGKANVPVSEVAEEAEAEERTDGGKDVPVMTNAKQQNINYLTTNCNCWKGAEKSLETLNEKNLQDLVDGFKRSKEFEDVVNALREFPEFSELTVNAMPAALAKAKGEAGSEEEETETDAEEMEENEFESDDQRQAFFGLKAAEKESDAKKSAKGSKGKGKGKKPTKNISLGGGSGEASPLKSSSSGADLSGVSGGGSVANAGNLVREPMMMTYEQWMAAAPPEIQSAVRNSINLENAHRQTLIGRLTLNVKDEERKKLLINKFSDVKRYSLDDLAEMVSLIPVPVTNQQNGNGHLQTNQLPGMSQTLQALYFPGHVTANQQKDEAADDLLEPIVANYEEWAKEYTESR